MTTIVKGNLLDVTQGFIMQQVNCKDVMGAGVAKAIYTKYPVVKEQYHESFVTSAPELLRNEFHFVQVTPQLIVVNSYTQFTYGKDGTHHTDDAALIENIKRVAAIAAKHHTNLCIPYKIGCGLGGGDWDRIYDGIDDIDNLFIIKLK